MALNRVLIALTCAVAFPVAALAQSPAWTMTANADCCATDDGSALAASVLLPSAFALPSDDRATALAASVLLPAPSEGCCGATAAPSATVDHSAHLGMPAGKQAGHGMADMACCNREGTAGAAKADAGCCQDMKDGSCCKDMKDGCGMPCCQSMPPTR